MNAGKWSSRTSDISAESSGRGMGERTSKTTFLHNARLIKSPYSLPQNFILYINPSLLVIFGIIYEIDKEVRCTEIKVLFL